MFLFQNAYIYKQSLQINPIFQLKKLQGNEWGVMLLLSVMVEVHPGN